LSEHMFTELELKTAKRFRNHFTPDSEGVWLDDGLFPTIISA